MLGWVLVVVRGSIGFAALRDMITDAGLAHVEIELIEQWCVPKGEPGNSCYVRQLLFDAAEALAPTFIKIGSENGPAPADPLALVGPLRELADQEAARGTRMAIEPMPFSAIATMPMGAQIVAAAGHPAAEMVIDAWHVFRGDVVRRTAGGAHA